MEHLGNRREGAESPEELLNSFPPTKIKKADYEKLLSDLKEKGVLLGESGKSVYVDPTNSKRVIAVFSPVHEFNDEEWRLDRINDFLVQKIAHALFHKNIPDIHLLTFEPASIIRDRVFPKDEERPHVFAPKFLHELDEAGFFHDSQMYNYIFDVDGNVQYIDDLGIHPKNLGLIENAIQERLKGDARDQALMWLGQLKKLWENPKTKGYFHMQKLARERRE